MNFQKFMSKKRAVSPVIASILLIGLAVLAGAAVVFIVLPLLNPTVTTDNMTVAIQGTVSVDDLSGGGMLPKTITLTINIGNAATATVTIGDIDSVLVGPGGPIGTSSSTTTYTIGGAIATTTDITPGNTKTLVVTIIATPTSNWPTLGPVNVQLDIEYKEPINSVAMYPAVGSFTTT